MRRQPEAATVPARIVTAIEKHFDTLLRVELQHKQGKNGHDPVPGSVFDRDENESDVYTPEELAEAIFEDACEHFDKTDTEEPRYRAVLFLPPKEGDATPLEVPINFEARGQTRESVKRASEKSEQLFAATLCKHFEQMYRKNERLVDAVSRVVESHAKMLPGLLQLRMDAMEDRAEAMLEGLGHGHKKKAEEKGAWDDTAKTVQTMIESFGPVAAAKVMGFTPEQAQEFMNANKPANDTSKNPPAKGGVRGVLVELGQSLTGNQQSQLLAKLGTHSGELMLISKLDDEVEAARRAESLMDKLAAEKNSEGVVLLDVLGSILDEKQQGFIDKLGDAIEAARKPG